MTREQALPIVVEVCMANVFLTYVEKCELMSKFFTDLANQAREEGK
jgi:hypothetical protein